MQNSSYKELKSELSKVINIIEKIQEESTRAEDICRELNGYNLEEANCVDVAFRKDIIERINTCIEIITDMSNDQEDYIVKAYGET